MKRCERYYKEVKFESCLKCMFNIRKCQTCKDNDTCQGKDKKEEDCYDCSFEED